MWDDHEIANNPWTNGENHQPDEAGARGVAALARTTSGYRRANRQTSELVDKQNGPFAYNRTVHFGDVISFVVMETRLVARTDPNANPAETLREFNNNVFTKHTPPARWAARRSRRHCAASPSGRVPEP